MTNDTFTFTLTHLAGGPCIAAPGEATTGSPEAVSCPVCSNLGSDGRHAHRWLFSYEDVTTRQDEYQCACGARNRRPADPEGRAARACPGLGGVVFYSETLGEWVESPCGACGGWHKVGDEADERVAR